MAHVPSRRTFIKGTGAVGGALFVSRFLPNTTWLSAGGPAAIAHTGPDVEEWIPTACWIGIVTLDPQHDRVRPRQYPDYGAALRRRAFDRLDRREVIDGISHGPRRLVEQAVQVDVAVQRRGAEHGPREYGR